MPSAWSAGTLAGKCGIIMVLVSVDISTPLDGMSHRNGALVVKRRNGGAGARIGGVPSISDGEALTGKYRGRTHFVRYLVLEEHGKDVVEWEISDCVIRGGCVRGVPASQQRLGPFTAASSSSHHECVRWEELQEEAVPPKHIDPAKKRKQGYGPSTLVGITARIWAVMPLGCACAYRLMRRCLSLDASETRLESVGRDAGALA
ncbi:hypothetical protein PC113_g4709 [Phytophthora cactorum]|uniref:Uncharacterized protein n=1 Tax=Phytophthora cactorum TaxID=29920 RepID=A0A8T0ZN84_9STRA|nr:hypothetical protein PC113_g4709 [Phytophthora cactorum]